MGEGILQYGIGGLIFLFVFAMIKVVDMLTTKGKESKLAEALSSLSDAIKNQTQVINQVLWEQQEIRKGIEKWNS